MSETKWTGGDWIVDSWTFGGQRLYALSTHDHPTRYWRASFLAQDGLVGQSFGKTAEEATANAQLQAAAPELYEALEKMASRGHFDTCDSCLTTDPQYPCNCGYVEGMAALKKARGE